jgi:predicted transcriptional regulator YdeE
MQSRSQTLRLPSEGPVIRGVMRKVSWLAGIAVTMVTCAVVALPAAKKVADMNPRAVEQDGFTVVGIAVRTSNAEQMTAARPIGKQWERLFKEGVLAAIPNKADEKIVAVYSQYATDKDGEYTYLLGARVRKVESVPAGMTLENVPAGRYALFTSEARSKKWWWRCGVEFGRRRRMRWAETGLIKRISRFTISGRKIRRTPWWICMWRCGRSVGMACLDCSGVTSRRSSAFSASGWACTACGPPAAVEPRISERTRCGY